ncbi:MAG TPA: ABC transporter substrate binding protein [Nitrospirota bacterium]
MQLPFPSIGYRKKLLSAAALLLCLLSAPLAAASAHVLIIKDTEIKPYRDAIEGFKSTCGLETEELNLADTAAIDEALKRRPDAVAAIGTRAFRKARSLRNLPVIYAMVMPSEAIDPGGGNLSGVSMEIDPETYLSAMAALFPGAKRIGLLFDPEQSGGFVAQASAAAAQKGLILIPKKLRDPRQVPALLEEMRGKIDAFWMIPDPTAVKPETIDVLMLFSFRNNIPIFSFSEKYVEKGAVAALRIDPRDMGAQAGEIARALVNGGKGPVRAFARKPRLVVNTKVGAKIGVSINGELFRNAEKME